MVKFPSKEWCETYQKLLNESEEYEAAATEWEGDMMYIIEGEGEDLPADEKVMLYLDLWHGKCREAGVVFDEGEKPDVAFKVRGPESVWKIINEGKEDPIKLIMTQRLSVEGDMNKIMRAGKAALPSA